MEKWSTKPDYHCIQMLWKCWDVCGISDADTKVPILNILRWLSGDLSQIVKLADLCSLL